MGTMILIFSRVEEKDVNAIIKPPLRHVGTALASSANIWSRRLPLSDFAGFMQLCPSLVKDKGLMLTAHAHVIGWV
jgi:hypothetical protein